jgi:hypothetical protein
VAARLLPSFGDPLGARVALLEVTRSMRKRAFSLSFLFFLVSGFTPRDQEGKGWGRRGHAFVLQVISQMILVQAETIISKPLVLLVSLHCHSETEPGKPGTNSRPDRDRNQRGDPPTEVAADHEAQISQRI